MSNKTGLCYPEGGCRLNLLICDDEPSVVEQVSALLRDHCEKSGISAHFYPFSDPGAIKDLSSYDAVITWNATIPFITTYFGNHISLFCLLMTIVSFIYTKINMQSQMATNQQMPGMNIIMYFTPIMMWFWFNDYASGLSYYYFISSLITIIQTYAIRAFVDDKKLLAGLHAKRNSKTPAKKKSGFMDRLEKMQREQEKALKERNKKR